MSCNCGKGQAHSTIATTEAVMLAERLRRVLGDEHAVEPQTVVCVEDDSWHQEHEGWPDEVPAWQRTPSSAVEHKVSKIVVTFHDVSDVQWLTEQLARTHRP